MDKEDGRKLPREVQHERRKQAVRLHGRGVAVKEIAALLGVARGTVYRAVSAAQEGDMRALAPKVKGRAPGDKRRLSATQELHIQRLICKNRPEQLKLTFALWTRAAVVLLVQQEFDLELPVRTIGDYLKRWGFTPQKPIKRAYEQRPEAVKAWPDEEYPAITTAHEHAQPKPRTSAFLFQ
jgi:transposase